MSLIPMSGCFSVSLITVPWLAFWQSVSFQIIFATLFITLSLVAYLYRIRSINRKNKQLYELNSRLMIEINERRKAEKDLMKSKKRFIQLSQATFEAIFITDQFIIKETNQSAVDMFGYLHDELIGMSLGNLLTPLYTGIVNDVFLDSNNPYRAMGVKKDSSVFFVELRSKNIDYDNEKLKVLAVTDITEKVEADKQNEILEEQLRHAQKMEAVGNLASGVAHDFNNMLQVILGFSEMASRKLKNNDSVHAYISQIMVTTEKAANLTRQLMTFGRKQAYKPQVLDINTIIINLQNILSGLLNTNITVERKLQSKIPNIFADPGQLEQILINLIVNARDALNVKKTGSEKKIEIITSTVKVDDTFLTQHIDISPVDHVSIEVKDNGCGIAEEIQQRIYEPFFTTKPEGKGTGLGLSTVYGIIKQNKAIISFESKVEVGTSFKILWPVSDIDKKEKVKMAGPAKNTLGNETILLVEDEEGIRNFAVLSLQQNGYKVYSAENGRKALQLIEEEHITFDLLVSDLNMPDMDGDELVGILNKKIPNLKTLIMSGYGDDLVSGNGFKNRINFLQKPFSIKKLLEKVRVALDRN